MSDAPSQPEPPPTGEGEPVTPALIARLREAGFIRAADLVAARSEFGRQKYGTVLRLHNGRDPIEDLRQEIGDAIQYAEQADREGRSFGSEIYELVGALTALVYRSLP